MYFSGDLAAAAHCSDLKQVDVRVGDLRAIPAAGAAFDAALSTQVIEYVADVGTALGEIARITRRGGRFVNVATNWGSLFWSGGDEGVTARVLSAWHRHVHPSTFAHGAGRLMAAFAVAQGDVDQESADAWLASLERADAEGLHFLSLVPVLTTATRI